MKIKINKDAWINVNEITEEQAENLYGRLAIFKNYHNGEYLLSYIKQGKYSQVSAKGEGVFYCCNVGEYCNLKQDLDLDPWFTLFQLIEIEEV